jgi:tetratricopeptide (TPR) repeat protein
MVKDKKKNDGLGEVEVALSRTEQFLENHLNLVIYVVVGIIVLVLGVLGVQKYLISPRNIEAQEQMFVAQNYFSIDSFNLALNGDGVSLGFLDVMDDYGSTKSGNLAKYYSGVSFYHLGEYDQAIKYLKKFKTSDLLLAPLAQTVIGDSWVELGQLDKAISAYKKALSDNNNEFTTPTVKSKLALVYEEKGDKAKALELYNEIKNEFPTSSEITTIEKSIARLNQ